MKKTLVCYIVVALLVAVGVFIFVNKNDKLVRPSSTQLDVLQYNAKHSQNTPENIIEKGEANVNDEVRAMLLSLGLEERFSSLLREQTLQAYAEADVLRVVVAKPDGSDIKKELVMCLTVADVGDDVYVSVDIELPRHIDQRFEDVVGVAMDACMTVDANSYFASIGYCDRETVSLVLGDDYKAEEVDRGVGFSIDLSKLMEYVELGEAPFRLHFEYKATYEYKTTAVYNALLCYEHLKVPHDGRTGIGRTSQGVCYEISDNSSIISDRHFFITPEPFVAYSK